MEGLLALFVAVVALIGLDMASATWGVDSRPQLPDDHRR
jgi:hypothetical protein